MQRRVYHDSYGLACNVADQFCEQRIGSLSLSLSLSLFLSVKYEITTDRRLTRSLPCVIPDVGIITPKSKPTTRTHVEPYCSLHLSCARHGGLSFATNTFDENSVSPAFDSPLPRYNGNFSPWRKCFCLLSVFSSLSVLSPPPSLFFSFVSRFN